MKVLYANHTAQLGGAEYSLLELLTGLPAEVHACMACPIGPLSTRVEELGIPVGHVQPIDASFRIQPIQTPKGIIDVTRTGLGLRRLARQTGAQLIHANSLRAALSAVVAKKLGGPPVVVHVRDWLPRTRMAELVRRIILEEANAIIANSQSTAASLGKNGHTVPIAAIHNPLDLRRFSPDSTSRDEARSRLGLSSSDRAIGLIAQITPWKRQEDAVRIMALLGSYWEDLHLFLVGEPQFKSQATRHDNVSYLASLRQLVDQLDLKSRVHFLGHRDDVPEILRALDVALIPSAFEPFGRSVIEAMAMGVPVVATRNGGPAEIITDGIDGILLEPEDPDRWAAVIDQLLRTPEIMRKMAYRARLKVVSQFTREKHVQQVLGVYSTVLSSIN